MTSLTLNTGNWSHADEQRLAQNRLERKRRLSEERLRYFEPTASPFNEQREFIYSKADERWIFGGNRSGKTEAGVSDCLMFVLGKHPVRSEYIKPPVYVRYCAPKYREGVKDVLHKKFKQLTPRSELQGGSWSKAWKEGEHKLYFKNGSNITFKSYEEDPDTFGGSDLDAVYQDEHSPKRIYDENKMRLIDRDGYFASTMTPEEGQTWEEDHILHPDEGTTIEHWFFDTEHNPHLSKEGIAKVKARLSKQPILAEAKLHGRFVALGGKLLPQFNPSVHIVPDRPLMENAYRVFCIDTHTRTPSAAMWAAWEPPSKGLPFMRFIVYRTCKFFMTVPEWQKHIKSESHGEKIQRWLFDEPTRGAGLDINLKKSILEQFNEGPDKLPMKQVKKPPKSFDGDIFRLWDMLSPDPISNKSQIEIFESCNYPPEFINSKWHGSLPWEISRYQFKKEKKADEETLRENVREVDDHLIAAMRYLTRDKPSWGTREIRSAIPKGSW